MAKQIKVIFLGGIEEIGKNMTALEYNDRILIIDAGLAFPNGDMPGVDAIIPDITYLKQNSDKISAIVLTHGHEDHIGGLPYILKEISCPVYGTAFTLGIVEHKLSEAGIDTSCLKAVEENSAIEVEGYTVEFIKVCHSIAGASSLAITTELGVIFVSGDYKFDYTPIDGKLTNIGRIGEIGKKGVLLMLGESTNVEREGHSRSERKVGESLDAIFGKNADRRLIISTFATNSYRVQQILDLAAKYNRKVVLSGRSMINLTEIGEKLGEVRFDASLIIDTDKANKLSPEQVVIICTGTQGEPMSALSRMSTGDFNRVKIGERDTVVLSSSPIPGNEKSIYKVINNLYRKGAEVIYDALYDVHASGHAFKEELKCMLQLVKPIYFVPVHGEYRHLKKHAELAQSMGVAAANIKIPEIGMVLGVSRRNIVRMSNVPSGNTFVDGSVINDDAEGMLRVRNNLAKEGFIIVLTTVQLKTGAVLTGPEIISRGFNTTEALNEEFKRVVLETLKSIDFSAVADYIDVKTVVRKSLGKYISKTFQQNPMILPMIIEG